MTTTAELYRRAGALCIAAEPHSEITDWPCEAHIKEAARELGQPVPKKDA